MSEESAGALTLIHLGRRLTPHLRHPRSTWTPVAEGPDSCSRANGTPPERARTLRRFLQNIEQMPSERLSPYVRRGDFSRWIAEVYGDHALAEALRGCESRFQQVASAEGDVEIAGEIRAL